MTPSDLNKIAEFRRMIKNYLKMKVIKKMDKERAVKVADKFNV